MNVRCMHFNKDFGFIALQTERPEECWLIHSKLQGRLVLSKLTNSEQAYLCFVDLQQSPLPETSELEPLSLKGRISETLSYLMSPMAELSQGQPVLLAPSRKGSPSLCFLLEPLEKDVGHNPTGLICVRDGEGDHAVFVFYSRKQGRGILDRHCWQMDPERVAKAKERMEKLFLPEESVSLQVRICDPMAAFLKHGYLMTKQGF